VKSSSNSRESRPLTHAPHGPEVEQILSNLVALFTERRASCYGEGAVGRDFVAKRRPKKPTTCAVHGLLRQKPISDNQNH
jgi:hypothetical protein